MVWLVWFINARNKRMKKESILEVRMKALRELCNHIEDKEYELYDLVWSIGFILCIATAVSIVNLILLFILLP